MVNTRRRRIAQCAGLLMTGERVNGHLARVLRCLHVNGSGLLGEVRVPQWLVHRRG